MAIILSFVIPRLKSVDKGPNDAAAFRPPATPVSVMIVQPGRLQDKILTTGTVLANEEVELQSEISGKVTAIFFEEGSRVKQGQLLLRSNDEELQARLKKAEFQKQLAQQKEERGRKQFEIDAISQQDYDIILNELNVQKAEVDLISAQLAKTEIIAPFDGTIGLRYVSLGSYMSPNTRIANLLATDPVKVDFSIPGKYVAQVSKGNEISFKIQGSDDVFKGEVYAIEPKVDPVTRTARLRALSPNPGGRILAGSFVEVELVLDEIEDALMVPTESIIPYLNGQRIYLLKDGKVAPQPVETGLRTEASIQITAGVQPGDSVLTTGILQVRLGSAVSVTKVE